MIAGISRRHFAVATVAFAFAALALATAPIARAQSTVSALEEVVVSARKREESLRAAYRFGGR